MGVTFDCPCPRCQALAPNARKNWYVPFANPIDGGEPLDRTKNLWQRTGETFETLTLSPSVDVSKYGCWHGHIQNGEITNAS